MQIDKQQGVFNAYVCGFTALQDFTKQMHDIIEIVAILRDGAGYQIIYYATNEEAKHV